MSCLRAEGLRKCYGRRAVVDGISLEISSRTVVGLLGPNGAGKTTSFYLIAGLIAPDGGHLYLDGASIGHLPYHERARGGIQYLPQEPSVFRYMSVEQNLLTALENESLSAGRRRERAEELLRAFRLDSLRTQQADTLSSGERRRVEIARALATSPRVLLLDEPFSGIDPISVAELQGVIRDLVRDGLAVVLTDHNVRETLHVTDYAYVINEGKVLLSGTPDEISQHPLARQHYLGEGFQL